MPPATRRDFLRATAGAAGLAFAGDAAADPLPPPAAGFGRAKACIFINLVGGPGQLDTFDPKPAAPSGVRGPFRPIQTRVPGLHLSELFPKLAGVADKFALVRSMHHDAPPIHEAGFQLLNTGRLFRDGPEWPNVGAVATYILGQSEPTAWSVFPHANVSTGISVSHGLGRGFLDLPDYYPGQPGRRYSDEDCAPFEIWTQVAVAAVRAGTRFVTINMFPTVFDAPSWDCHADRGSLSTTLNDYRDTVAPSFDTAFAALLTNLYEHGLLDTTLVVATGEFGRTPHLNANGGRDHWAGCWTATVAGGGVKGGRVVGASDETGGAPAARPVTPQELVATIFHALGVAPTATIPGPAGEAVAVYPARPVAELF